jgi:AbrB family looped-hinge helix DNA binding protein
MKATGVVRRLDDLGRLCLPKEIRRTLHISPGDPIEFFVDDNSIILRRYDSYGDMQQLLDNMERNIRLSDTLITSKQLNKLLDKLKEMRAILREENRK